MPELPEIAVRAKQMDAELVGRTFCGMEVLQPKSLNVPVEEFVGALQGATIRSVIYRGKWLFVETSQGWLLLNLGMGGEILLTTRSALPEKRRLIFDFDDGSCLSVNFWWLGYAHYVPVNQLHSHRMTASLGPNALDLSLADLHRTLSGQRRAIKSLLLDQSRLAGIGNAYVHDILFLARLHPMRRTDTLTDEETERLWVAIRDGLQPSLRKGGAFYEVDLHGQKGGFTMDDILVGYKEGRPCPVCGTLIQKIRTGSTSSFICPQCQAMPAWTRDGAPTGAEPNRIS